MRCSKLGWQAEFDKDNGYAGLRVLDVISRIERILAARANERVVGMRRQPVDLTAGQVEHEQVSPISACGWMSKQYHAAGRRARRKWKGFIQRRQPVFGAVPEAGTIANNSAAGADPASFNPSGWGLEDTLWIAVDTNGMTNITNAWTACGAGTLFNYSDLANSNTTDSSILGQTEVAVSFSQFAASAEDRGAVSTHDLTNARNSALIISVRPVPAMVNKIYQYKQAVNRASTY